MVRSLVYPSGRRSYGLPRQTARLQRPLRTHRTGIPCGNRKMVHTLYRWTHRLWRYADKRLPKTIIKTTSICVPTLCGTYSVTATPMMFTYILAGASYHLQVSECSTTRRMVTHRLPSHLVFRRSITSQNALPSLPNWAICSPCRTSTDMARRIVLATISCPHRSVCRCHSATQNGSELWMPSVYLAE